MDDRISKRIIIINGKGTSGKDTFVNIVNKYVPTENYSSINLIKKVATQLGYNGGKTMKDRKFLSDMKVLATKYNDSPYNDIIDKVLKFIYCKQNKNQLLFIHIREPKEIQRLVDFCKESNIKVNTLLIKRENIESVEYGNMADDNVYNYDYDFVINNDGTVDDLLNTAIWYLCRILNVPVNYQNNITKYVRMKNGKLQEHVDKF